MFDGKTIGSFTHQPYPCEKVEVSFQPGLRVDHLLEIAGENGMVIELLPQPKVEP
jgi:hypothetical protein